MALVARDQRRRRRVQMPVPATVAVALAANAVLGAAGYLPYVLTVYFAEELLLLLGWIDNDWQWAVPPFLMGFVLIIRAARGRRDHRRPDLRARRRLSPPLGHHQVGPPAPADAHGRTDRQCPGLCGLLLVLVLRSERARGVVPGVDRGGADRSGPNDGDRDAAAGNSHRHGHPRRSSSCPGHRGGTERPPPVPGGQRLEREGRPRRR
jgi:hypothetical protein